MEQLICDLNNRGLSSIDAIINRFRHANLISSDCAAKVRRLLRSVHVASTSFDVAQLNEILETISREGNIPVDILISEITATTTLANHKSEVIAAFYSWKRSPLARMLNSLTAGKQTADRAKEPEEPEVKETVSAFQVENKRKKSPRTSRSSSRSSRAHKSTPRSSSRNTPSRSTSRRSTPKNTPKATPRATPKPTPRGTPRRQATPDASDAEDNEYSCHGGYCATASEDTMSELDVPKYPELDTELPRPEDLSKSSRDRIEEIKRQHEREKYQALTEVEKQHHSPPVDRFAMESFNRPGGKTETEKGSFSSMSYNVSLSEDESQSER